MGQDPAQDETPAPLVSVAGQSNRVESALGSTKASTLFPTQLKISEDVIDEEASESSYATTEITAETEGALRIPAIPEQGQEAGTSYAPTAGQPFRSRAKQSGVESIGSE